MEPVASRCIMRVMQETRTKVVYTIRTELRYRRLSYEECIFLGFESILRDLSFVPEKNPGDLNSLKNFTIVILYFKSYFKIMIL